MKKIRIWWLNPVVLYTMLMLLVLFANNMSSIKYSSLFGMKKGIEFKYLLLYALVYVLFVLGYLLSKKYKIKSNIMDDYYKESVNEKTVYQVFNVLFVLCIGAYLIWFGNPEFNNSSGLLAFYSNFGFFGIPLQVIFGYLIGRSYRMFKRGNILGIVIYFYVVYLLLELPRFFSFGTLQFFLFYGCSFNILDYG